MFYCLFKNRNRLKIVIDKFIKEHKTRDSFNFLQPCILNSIRIILSGGKGTKYFYENLNERHLTLIFKQKWHDDLKVDLKDDIWRQLFRICFKTIQDPYFKWFQYRIMHRILGTQIILHIMGVADSNKCLLCRSTSEETLLHLFFSCPEANKCKTVYDEQKLLASLEFQSDKFLKQWQQMKNVF